MRIVSSGNGAMWEPIEVSRISANRTLKAATCSFSGDTTMQRLWTWDGKYFGHRHRDDLFTSEGQRVGRFRGDDIFDLYGIYLGEVLDSRLVTSKVKRGGMGPRSISDRCRNSAAGRCGRQGTAGPVQVVPGGFRIPSEVIRGWLVLSGRPHRGRRGGEAAKRRRNPLELQAALVQVTETRSLSRNRPLTAKSE